MKRHVLLRPAPAAALATVLASLAAPAAPPTARGAFVAAEGADVPASTENVVLSWDGTTERVLLSMDALTDSTEAALLIPAPSPAEAALADTSVFSELEEVTAPEEVVE